MPQPKPLPDHSQQSRHRNKYEVTLARLASMSPAELRTLGAQLQAHEGGEYIMKLILGGYEAYTKAPKA